jgi:hypothetical protein
MDALLPEGMRLGVFTEGQRRDESQAMKHFTA